MKQMMPLLMALVGMISANVKATEQDLRLTDVPRTMADLRGSRAERMMEMAKSRNMPIEMYGKVIDQYGMPVEGAKVHMVIAGGGEMAPGTGLIYVITDAVGRFVVKGRGNQIQILRVEHPNVAAYLTLDPSDEKRIVGRLLRAGDPYHHGEEHSWMSYLQPQAPLILDVWRVNTFEDVKFGSGGFYPVPNGKPSELRGIVVSCKRDAKEQGKHWRQQQGSWSITFRPINGGIQETNDVYTNEAPQSGYQSELTIAMQRGQPGYKPNIYPGRRFYYTAYDGKWHGSFEATFDPFMYEKECRVNVDYKYNTSGSRSLAVKTGD